MKKSMSAFQFFSSAVIYYTLKQLLEVNKKISQTKPQRPETNYLFLPQDLLDSRPAQE